MPSPFPGMNPYLEQRSLWRGFHNTFLVALQAAVTPHVVPRYYVEYEESLYIDDSDPGPFAVADVAVADPSGSGPHGIGSGPVAAVAVAPVTAVVAVPRQRKTRRLVIHDTQGREVVTVVELLSPSNKQPGKNRERYLDKRAEVQGSAANLVEIDLLRGGERMPIRTLPECAYYVMVSRRPERPRVGLWPVGLRDPLPTIPIPLRPGEPEPMIPLKPVLDRVYDEAGYRYRVYAGSPDPPLPADDAAWANGFVPAG